jgi:hypothetical protein
MGEKCKTVGIGRKPAGGKVVMFTLLIVEKETGSPMSFMAWPLERESEYLTALAQARDENDGTYEVCYGWKETV